MRTGQEEQQARLPSGGSRGERAGHQGAVPAPREPKEKHSGRSLAEGGGESRDHRTRRPAIKQKGEEDEEEQKLAAGA